MDGGKSASTTYLNLARVQVRAARADATARYGQELTAHHFLTGGASGRELRLADRRMRRPVGAVLLWCAAAQRLKAREEWIGWDPRTRAERLKLAV